MSKETIKESLKPTKGKILLFSIFILLNGLISMHTTGFLTIAPGDTTAMYGIPLVFYKYVGCPIFPPEEVALLDCPWSYFNALNLILDIVLWYFVSCLIIFAYSKFRTKK